jgi:hypothetical protein
MYKCQITGKQSRQGDPRIGELYYVGEVKTEEGIRAPEKLNRIVVETRERVYTRWVKNEETNKYEEVEAGRGWEIVREINASAEGLALWESWTPEERAVFLKHMD